MSEWQPIETAPKTGQEILLYGEWAGEISGPDPRAGKIFVGQWLGGRSDYPGYEWHISGTDAYSAWMKATHWQPLPEPPPCE